jgi:hypothetical protein
MAKYICPTSRHSDGDIIGCGAEFEAKPDFEGLVDCPECGIWFNPKAEFNPALAQWLNDRDHTTAEWPHDLSHEFKLQADKEVGGGQLLNFLGWPTYITSVDKEGNAV